MFKFFPLVLLTAIGVVACKKTDAVETNYTYQIATLKKSYSAGLTVLTETYNNEAEILGDHVNGFASLPIFPRFENAKEAWVNTKSSFYQLIPFLYADHLENSQTQLFLDQSFLGFNKSFLDSTEDNPNTGIIYDEATYPNLDYGTLIQIENASSNPNDRVFGFKPLEFMLFGEDKSFTEPGTRTYFEYSIASKGQRRRDLLRGMVIYLDVQAAQIQKLQNDQTFQLMSANDALSSILNGVIRYVRSEVVERSLLEPLAKTQNQNEILEVSQYSDATNLHLMNMIQGVEGFLDGRPYHVINSNYYLIDFIREIDESIYNRIVSSLDESSKLLSGLDVDFDQALNDQTYHKIIERVAQRLSDLADALEEFKELVVV